LIPGTRGIVNGQPNISSIYSSAGGTGSAISGTGTGGSTVGSAISAASSAARTIGGLALPGGSSSSTTSWDPLLKNAQDIDLTGSNGGFNGSGTTAATAATGGAATAALGIAGAGMGAYSAYQSTVSAFEKGAPLQGALADASAGAALGALGGPIGMLIGAGAGAGLGASAGLLGMVSGEAGNLGARDYYEKNVLPSLESSMTLSTTDFQSAVSSVGNTATQAMAYMQSHFGASAADWVQQNYMQKEVQEVLASIEDKASGGRQYLAMSASQFHTGGMIDDFGSLSTSSNEGFIHAMRNEFVMNTQAAATHGSALSAMNGGASVGDVASMYLAQARPSSSMSMHSSGGDTHHWSVNALDGPSFSRFLKNGGAQQIVKHTNGFKSQYAGDGISG
jgi:hypothetical protein